jgi:signal transduction histidine kinase/DNA-binding response OmpR family regulator
MNVTPYYHLEKSADLYKIANDYTDFCALIINLANLSIEDNKLNEALAYLDTAQYYHPAYDVNNIHNLHKIFQSRGEAYQKLGLLDSAIANYKNARLMELEYLKQENLDKVVEIDNLYNVGKKNKEIELEKSRKNTISILVILLLIFIGVLFYYYFKLRNANKLTTQQAKELQTLDKAKSRFFANVSHELRTPLTLMLGPINILLSEFQFDERQTKLLKIASKSGNNLTFLVNDILDLGKLDSGKMTLNTKNSNLNSFFGTCFAQFESVFNHKNISYDVNDNIDENLVAEIDQVKCRQIVNNLVSNALKHTPENGQIAIDLNVKNAQLILRIANSGNGISTEDLPNIFDRYYQGGDTYLGGTGIGLALCKEYTQLFEGEISAYNSVDGLAVFELNFPLKLAQSIKESVVEVVQSDASFKEEFIEIGTEILPIKNRPSILFVEDNPQLQEYISLILEKDYEVTIASNGQEALDKLSSMDNCELILSDLMMPIMDGYQLLENIKSNEATRNLPTIMLTARADIDDKLKALRIGVDDYITKPFQKEELLVRISNLLKNKAVREATVLKNDSDQQNISTDASHQNEWLTRFEGYIQSNCGNANLTIPEIAEEFAMSESTLLRQLKKQTGLSTMQFIQEVRLRKALKVLEQNSSIPIKELAIEVGYKDSRTFSKSFKKHFGKLPSELTNF